MDNTTAAPAAEATPAAPAESQASQSLPPPETRDTRRSTAADRLKEFLSAKSAAKQAEIAAMRGEPATHPADSERSAAKVDATVAKIEKAGAEAVEQKAGESDAKYELRLAKQLRELRTEKDRASKFERTATEASAKAAKLEALIESGKANPLAVLEHLGFSFADVVKGINEDKFKAPEKRLDLPPEIAEKLERLDRAEREREQKAMTERAQAEQVQHVKQVSDYIKENAEDFPLVFALPEAAQALVREAYANKVSDILPLIENMEAGLAKDLGPMLSSETAVKALLKHQPALKDVLVKALGLDTTAPAAKAVPAEPKGIGSLSSDPGTPAKKMSKEQKVADAVRRLQAARKG